MVFVTLILLKTYTFLVLFQSNYKLEYQTPIQFILGG
ncbi:Uncharacterised protein [Staphylococcus nepalensis]|nr:Uncharacterised protein [Staphylococcus nepalensis]SUM95797.1 Uncharacterised protein [Staphylococcus nepalensis]